MKLARARATLTAVLFGSLLASIASFAQGNGYNASQLTTFTSVGSSTKLTQSSLILYHQITWTPVATSACAVTVDSSPDGVTWTTGGIISSQTCTAQGSSAVVNAQANFLRVTVSTLTGTGASVAVQYEGWAYNPSPSSGGGSFSSITSGTNTTAIMTVGSGAEITATGSGSIVATSCPSCASSGLNVSTTASPSIPSPLFSPSETPASTNPFIFSQDANGAWHTQAVIDTTSTNSPLTPGALTWTRQQFYRDNLAAVQGFKNSFMAINHGAQINTVSTNQDRALAISMSNPTGVISAFSITSNTVTFIVSLTSEGPGVWYPGQNIVATGLSTGTYLNNQFLTVATVAPDGANFFVTAPFTHANVSLTTDAGQLDLHLYSMENLQMELDMNGNLEANSEPDAEYRTLSLQFSENAQGTNSGTSPDLGEGTIRADYTRPQTATGGNYLNTTNALLDMINLSTSGTQGEFWINLELNGQDEGGAAQTSYAAMFVNPPNIGNFSRDNWGIYIPNWPTKAHGTFTDLIANIGTGEWSFAGHYIYSLDIAGTATVAATTTSISVTYSAPYLGANHPAVTLTPEANAGFYWVTHSGSTGDWTGFTINLASALVGNVVFDYHVDGQL